MSRALRSRPETSKIRARRSYRNHPPHRHNHSRVNTKDDLLLGRMAVSSRMITEAQLKQCLDVQQKDSPPRPLGHLLVELDFLTIGQLDHLIQSQAARFHDIEERSKIDPREALFGRLAIELGHVSTEQLHECLREQANIARLKIFFRLGEILIKKGYVTPEVVKEILKRQRKEILKCPRCGARYNIATLDEKARLTCKKCGSPLTLPAEDPSVVVKETLRMDARQFRTGLRRFFLPRKKEGEED